MEAKYTISVCSPIGYPMRVISVSAFCGDKERDVFANPNEHWEEMPRVCVIEFNAYSMPDSLHLEWLSVVERKCYHIDTILNAQRAELLWKKRDEESEDITDKYGYVVFGLAPYGGVTVWLASKLKWELVETLKAEEYTPGLEVATPQVINDVCRQIMEIDEEARKATEYGLPQRNMFDLWMKQYRYRYVVLEEYWNGEAWMQYDAEDEEYDEMFTNVIKDQRYDGTRDQLNDGGLLRYHEAGRPKRLCVGWEQQGFNYSAFFWLDDKPIATAFERLMMMDLSASIDILVRLDPLTQHFALALNTESLMQPMEVPQEAYQLLVFKERLEFYRSENYNQPDEAWLW